MIFWVNLFIDPKPSLLVGTGLVISGEEGAANKGFNKKYSCLCS